MVASVASLLAADDVYSEETLRIARKLYCPVCAGQTVADSQAGLARQMRETIENKVQAGESEDEILDFFVARYGETVLVEPPKQGFNLTLWWLPVLVLAIAGLVVVLYIREHTGGRPAQAEYQSDDELESIAREVLDPDTGTKAG